MAHIDTGKTADVHPDEVKNMEAAGFVKAEAKPKAEPKAKAKAKK